MAFDIAARRRVFARTDGHCHLCQKKLCFNNYGVHGARGAWHVEHSKCQANGGSDHGNNLYPACIRCNLKKGTYTTRTARRWNGFTKAPLSKQRKDKIRAENIFTGGALGALAGIAALGTGGGVILCASLGALLGRAFTQTK